MAAVSGIFGKWPFKSRTRGRAIVAGSFTTVNGGAPTGLKGEGWTVARTAEGRWTVTLEKPCVAFDSIVVSMARETLPTDGSDELIQTFVDQDTISASTGVFEIQSYLKTASDGAPAPVLDDAPGAEISFIAVVRDSGQA